jgi:hypothetical protein
METKSNATPVPEEEEEGKGKSKNSKSLHQYLDIAEQIHYDFLKKNILE